MTMIKRAIILVATVTIASGQRGSFAGFRPIGYPDMAQATTVATNELGNRFGEDNSTSTTTTTQRLPIEANGDRELIDRLSKLPVDNQPFWFINWQAIEANRKKPQTYPQRPSQFAGSHTQTQHDIGNLNPNPVDTGVISETTPTKGSGNRDVDVTSFLTNPSGSSESVNAGRPTPNPANINLNSGANDDSLSNRLGNEPTRNSNPTTPVTPTQNEMSSAPAVFPTIPSPVPSSPSPGSNAIIGYGQAVSSFASMPYKPFSASSIIRRQKQVQTTTGAPPRIVNGILTDNPDYPYPILDPKTRNPSLITNNARLLGNERPLSLRNGFRDYDFEEQHPILSPYGAGIVAPFYY